MAIEYTDGVETEATILKLLEDPQADLGSETAIAGERYSSWPIRYHLCPERSNLVRHLCFDGLEVLELGAGMGGLSRYLAEKSGSLTVIEGTERRYRALQSRLRDLDNWSGKVGNIEAVDLGRKFDVVCVIGVLEYAELFLSPQNGLSAFAWFLNKARGFLKDEGALLLALENRLGLKYWNGAEEDHTGRSFDGICGYSPTKGPRTFSRQELLALLAQAGFGSVEEHYPFPDYKVPRAVLTRELVTSHPELAADIATEQPYESYVSNRVSYFSDVLALRGVAQAGLLSEFSNSFLFLASQRKDSHVMARLLSFQNREGEVGWYYSCHRKTPVKTVFVKPADRSAELFVKKEPLNSKQDVHSEKLGAGDFEVVWNPIPKQRVLKGEKLRHLLLSHLYFGNTEEFISELRKFLAWSFRRWGEAEDQLNGKAIDAIFTNASIAESLEKTEPGTYELFDLEWVLRGQMTKSWFICRNLCAFYKDFECFAPLSYARSFKELYLRLCQSFDVTPQLDKDCQLEATFSVVATGESDLKRVHAVLVDYFSRPFGVSLLARYAPGAAGYRGEIRMLCDIIQSLFHKMFRRIKRVFR